MTAERQLLTHSRMSTFKSCRRRAWYSYELNLRPLEDAKALRMGSAFHAGIEKLPDLAAACDAVRDVYRACPEQFDAYWWHIERETILRLVCGYQWRWANANLEVLATEQAFRLALINPATGAESKIFDLAGKIDGVVKLEDGRPAVKETKTVSDDLGPDSDLWRRLRIDHQISNYIAAARRIGFPVDTVLYDVARKPSIQPTPVPLTDEHGFKVVLDGAGQRVRTKDGKKWRESADTAAGYVLQTRPMTVQEWGEKLSADIAERPDFYFVRREVPRLDHDVAEYQEELWMIQQTLREAQRSGKWYRTVSRDTCPFCPYFEICSSNQDVTKEAPRGFQFVSDPNPELNGECNVSRTVVASVSNENAAPAAGQDSTAGAAPAAVCEAASG